VVLPSCKGCSSAYEQLAQPLPRLVACCQAAGVLCVSGATCVILCCHMREILHTPVMLVPLEHCALPSCIKRLRQGQLLPCNAYTAVCRAVFSSCSCSVPHSDGTCKSVDAWFCVGLDGVVCCSLRASSCCWHKPCLVGSRCLLTRTCGSSAGLINPLTRKGTHAGMSIRSVLSTHRLAVGPHPNNPTNAMAVNAAASEQLLSLHVPPQY
jgi:hypothetical protein